MELEEVEEVGYGVRWGWRSWLGSYRNLLEKYFGGCEVREFVGSVIGW